MTVEFDKKLFRKRVTLYLSICFIVLALDQLTKIWAVNVLKGQPDWNYLGGTLKLLYAENKGAWGSLGSNWPEPLKILFLIALPVLALAWFSWKMVRDHTVTIHEGLAFAFFLGGGFGNIIDRIRYEYVVDFLWMGIGPFTTNIFNIADVSIMCAIPLMLWDSFKGKKKEKKDPPETTTETSPS